jgi:hypothetical protein
MDNNLSVYIRELMTRFRGEIPFGNNTNWDNFGKMYSQLIVCSKLMIEPEKLQHDILEQLMEGNCNIVIWDIIINLLDESPRSKFYKVTKALVDGNMSTYGHPEITFDNLETSLNKWISEDSSKDDSMISNYGWNNYLYKVTVVPLGEELYQISTTLHQQPVNTQFDDLVQFGIYNNMNPNMNPNMDPNHYINLDDMMNNKQTPMDQIEYDIDEVDEDDEDDEVDTKENDEINEATKNIMVDMITQTGQLGTPDISEYGPNDIVDHIKTNVDSYTFGPLDIYEYGPNDIVDHTKANVDPNTLMDDDLREALKASMITNIAEKADKLTPKKSFYKAIGNAENEIHNLQTKYNMSSQDKLTDKNDQKLLNEFYQEV